jgi:hypothetical protein
MKHAHLDIGGERAATLSKRKKAPTESRNRGGFRLRPAWGERRDRAADLINQRSEPRFREAGGHEEV